MLQYAFNSAASSASQLATWGSSFWQDTACSYSFVQNVIGWCPTFCERYAPESLVGACQVVADYAGPVAKSIDPGVALYTTLALASLATAWYSYNQSQAQTKAQQQMFKAIAQQLEDLQSMVLEFKEKLDTMNEPEKVQEIDKIKRARAQLEAYLKQAGVADIFYGDKIREMGLDLLEKRANGEKLTTSDSAPAEEARLERTLAQKEQEQELRRKAKAVTPGLALHQQKAEQAATSAVSAAAPSVAERASLLKDIREKKRR